MRINRITAVRLIIRLGVMAIVELQAHPARSQFTMEDIVENVRRNESLYSNLDVTFVYEYSIGNRSPVQIKASADGGEVTHKLSRIRFVTQDGRFRLERAGTILDTKRESSNDIIRAFDGEKTRIYARKAIGNVVEGRVDDADFLRPHMILMEKPTFAFPLSTYLSGDDALRAHPFGRRWAKLRARSTISYRNAILQILRFSRY